MNKSLLNASFEESLNILDDPIAGEFIVKNLASAQEKEKYRGTIKSYIWLIILTAMFIFFPNWIMVKINEYLIPYIEKYANVSPIYNFLPESIFWGGAALWLFFIIILRKWYQNFILIYRGQFHMFVTFFCWLMLELNLMLITAFYDLLGGYFIFSFLVIGMIFSYFIIRQRKNSLHFLLYGVNRKVSRLENRMQTWMTKRSKHFIFIGGTTYILFLIVPKIFIINIGGIGIILMWIIGNLLFVLVESYYIFPYFLSGYYKLKYSEEYRDFEGKSVEEWYGKKYLKKHTEIVGNDNKII